MPVYPLEWEPLAKTGRYPNLAKHDAKIWENWLDAFGADALRVAYNAAFGGVALDEEQGTEAMRLGWQYSTALKPDVLIERADAVLVTEVKPNAGTSALGAALCYTRFAELERITSKVLVPCVITNATTPDIKWLAGEFGVLLFEVGGDL